MYLINDIVNVWRRFRRQDLIDGLLAVQDDLLSSIDRNVTDKHEWTIVHVATWNWLQARIASMNCASMTEAQQIRADADQKLERVARRAFLMPGMRGSWGRNVPRNWACSFDPVGSGCECAGGRFHGGNLPGLRLSATSG